MEESHATERGKTATEPVPADQPAHRPLRRLGRFMCVLGAGVLMLGGLGVGLVAVLAGFSQLPAGDVTSITLAIIGAVVQIGLTWLKGDPPQVSK